MPREMSSSEDEGDNTTGSSVTQIETEKEEHQYQCPADFVSFTHKPCSSTLKKSLEENSSELWLIKAPASFKPESFSEVKVPLSGLQSLRVPTGAKMGSKYQIYSLLASPHGTSGLCLLTSSNKSSHDVVFGPAFSGLLNVCETYGDGSANQAPQVIPAAPAPTIPPGLKQRFHPFGSRTPTLTCVAESEADGATFGPSSATLQPLVAKRPAGETWQEEDEEEGRKKKKKKKKKKKEKRIKTEGVEEAETAVKQEPATETQEDMTEPPLQEGEEKRKKKKKKKDREREEVEEGLEPSVTVEVEVKCEPMDTLYGDAVEGSGKKKKKKKSKRDDD